MTASPLTASILSFTLDNAGTAKPVTSPWR